MALTLIQTQSSYTPAYNPIVYVLSSTESTNDSFKFVVDILISGSIIATLKTVPDSEYGYGVIETAQLAQAELSTIFVTSSTFFSAKEGNREFTFNFKEEYSSGSLFLQTETQLSSSIYIWNGALGLDEWEDIFSGATNLYLIQSGSDAKPLSSSTEKWTSRNAKQWLYFLCSDQQSARYLYIDVKTESGSVGTYSLEMPIELQNTDELSQFGVLCGWKYLTESSPIQETATSPITTYVDLVVEYDVWIADSSDVRTTKKTSFYIDNYCEDRKYTQYALYYINRFGGIDTAVFRGLTQKTTNIERDRYLKKAGTLSSTGYRISSADVLKRDYNVKYNNRLQLSSKFMLEDDQEFFRDLYTAPFVWVDKPNENVRLQSANVIDTEFIQKNKINGIPFIGINIELSEDLRRQRV